MKITKDDKQIIDYWDSEKNSDKSPYDFSSGSTYKAWWKCPICNNSWQTTINHKYRGDKCPVCSGRKVVSGVNDLLSLFPDLAKEWDSELNDITPDKVYYKESKKHYWICPLGHKYSATLNHRINGTGCPICANKTVLVGFNDLQSRYPDIACDWNNEKNGKKTPINTVFGSGEKVFWKCHICGYEWKTSVSNRTFSKTGCPKCSAKKGGEKNSKNSVKNNNNLMVRFPNVALEWDYEKNYPEKPENVAPKSNKKYHWICSKCGWEYSSSPNTRTSGSGCPACANKVVYKGKNDLLTLFPEIANEWHPIKNGDLTPDEIVAGSNKEFWWKCSECGYEWKKSVSARTYGGRGCSICGIKKSADGHRKSSARNNNFKIKYPDIAAEWDNDKNGELKPEDFSCGSNFVASWICSFCHHKWESSIVSRTSSKSTCPNCSYVGTSFPQQAIFYYIKQIYDNTENRYLINNSEFDLFIPSINTAVEYDGVFYHKNSLKKDNDKDKICQDKEIILYRFRDFSLPDTDYARRITLKDGNIKSLNTAIKELLFNLGCNRINDVNVEKDQIQILSTYKREIEEKSLGKLFPNLLEEWAFNLNGALSPFTIKVSSNIKANWKCKVCGNVWQAQVSDRTRKDKSTGCPYCNNRRIVAGFNDLQTKHPDIAKEWHPTKNGDMLASMVAPKSNKAVWWLCSVCGGEWKASPSTRVGQGCGCPICAGKKVKIGYNDLATVRPDLAKEWNNDKNGDLTPQKITKGSNKKVWWKCVYGHEWQSTIHNRLSGKGCPECYKARKEKEQLCPGQLSFEIE